MTLEQKVQRINELAKKSKSIGLTDEEIVERDKLRDEYRASFKRNLNEQLKNIKIVKE